MTSIIEDYLREVETTLRVDAERKRQIVDELRSHLREKVADLRNSEPARAQEDVEREVLSDFGSPHDLALAYSPEGQAILTNQAGDIVLRLGQAVGRGATYVATDLGPRAARAVGRGTGRLLKVFAVIVSVLLILSIGIGVWAFYEVRPVVETLVEQSQPAYSYREECPGTPCNGPVPADTFYVSPGSKQVRVDLDVRHPWRENGTGSVTVLVKDPSGTGSFNRTFTLSGMNDFHHEMRWAPTEGNWTIAYSYSGFVGVVDVDVYATSIRWDDL